MIRAYHFQLDEVGEVNTRKMKDAMDIVVDLGGISKFLGVVFAIGAIILGGPFHDLDLSLSFRKMQEFHGKD